MEPSYTVKNPKFEISAVNPRQYPPNDIPEIVLVFFPSHNNKIGIPGSGCFRELNAVHEGH